MHVSWTPHLFALVLLSALPARAGESTAPEAAQPQVPPPTSFKSSSEYRPGLTDHTKHQRIAVTKGTLYLDRAEAVSLAGGVVLGLLPWTAVPRWGMTFTSAQFLTTPDGRQQLIGVLPILEVAGLGLGSWARREDSVELMGVEAALGFCATPHYDTAGWSFLGCVEYGFIGLNLEVTRGDTSYESQVPGFGKMQLHFTTEYNFARHFHANLTLGGRALIGDRQVRTPQGDSILQLGLFSAFATLGLGAQF